MYYQNITQFCASADTLDTTVTTRLLLDTNMLPLKNIQPNIITYIRIFTGNKTAQGKGCRTLQIHTIIMSI